ncbi:hypothetical protein BYT27DRAFT_7188042 [Phlegmacium glaucopus]|nr:hypothetical protein BYT27DRAFT_7188042 [Phlegmacium glaucopus]
MGASANTAERVRNNTAPQTHYNTFFHPLATFISFKSSTLISHGLGDGYYWFMGVHSFELCNARGGKRSSQLGMISKHYRI